MKIAVVEFAGRGGMIHYAYQLCDALSAAGADVTLLTDRHYELAQLPHRFRADAMLRLWDPKPAHDVRSSASGRAWRRVRRALRALQYYREWLRLIGRLRRERPDVVQFGDIRFATDLLPLAVLRRLGLRLADVCHNVRPFSGRWRSGALVRSSRASTAIYGHLYSQFDLIFAHFETNRRAIQETFDVGDRRVAAIVHGNETIFERLRDPEVTPARLRAALGLEPGQPVILQFGTLTRYKGPETMIRALPGVLGSHARACLVFAGYPAPDFDLQACRRLAAELGVDRAVRFVARYVESPAVAGWMELASVAVFPYRMVYQSGALMVALTFGVPVVATRVGAAADMVSDGHNGLLVEPENSAALAHAVSRVLTDRDLAARLGRAARDDARLRFGWDGVAQAMLNEYGRLRGVTS